MAEQKTDTAETPVAERESTSREFVRKIGPFGIIFFLAMFVFFLYWCFTDKPVDLLEGYTAPQTGEYYAENLPELQDELEANVLPKLRGVVSDELGDGAVIITLEPEDYFDSRYSLLQHFDEALFVFERSGD